ncbi:hypothetical protein LOZ66_003443 [Ophidiomyces ophidiicola]|nr:hypothetical protein LOZ66_003443 [Ophidiomyces ophidiicola]
MASRRRAGSISQAPMDAKSHPRAVQPRYAENHDDESLPPGPEILIIRGNSNGRSRASTTSSSFAERAKNLPPERQLPNPPLTDSIDNIQRSISTPAAAIKANTTESRSPQTQLSKNEEYELPSATQSSPHPQSSEQVISRTNLQATSKKDDAKRRDRDWAPARSPLQKLEVTLNDISKEEKRARIEEAEMLLKEAKAGRKNRLAVRDMRETPKVQEAGQQKRDIPRPATLEDTSISRRTSSRNKESVQRRATAEPSKPEPREALVDRDSDDYQDEVVAQRELIPNSAGDRRPFQPAQGNSKAPDMSFDQFMAGDVEYSSSQRQKIQPSANQFRSQSLSTSKSPWMQAPQSAAPPSKAGAPVHRSNSKKLQKPMPRELMDRFAPEASTNVPIYGAQEHNYEDSPETDVPTPRAEIEPETDIKSSIRQKKVDPVYPSLATVSTDGPSDDLDSAAGEKKTESRQKRMSVTFAVPPPTPPPLDEWRSATVCRLPADHLNLHHFDASKAWWEGGGSGRRKRNQSIANDAPLVSPKIKRNVAFDPPLHLRCGPLLRFTGIKNDRIDTRVGPIEREFWKGSIMIATRDSVSSYTVPPTLRIFSQPRDLIPPPPAEIRSEHGEQLAPEYVDPIAGLTKLGRNGKLLYVKPVDHIEEGRDLCFVENEDGLFEDSPIPLDYSTSHQVSKSPDERIKETDGESCGRYKEVKGFRLYADSARDVTFWRFNLEIELGKKQEHIAYRINQGSAQGFWVPAKGQAMNIMFYSGNCFSATVDTDKFSGPDPLWRDALNVHQTRPFHVMIGGGSQIYNDAVAFKTTHFQAWLDIKSKYEKFQHAFNLDIKAELEDFYLENYLQWFSQGLFGMANSQIPMVNMWDDHDIVAGFGSYPDDFMNTPVFSGLGNIAFKYYLLFQHQSVPEETHLNEPSWILGPTPGPFIHHQSRSILMHLGKRVALLAVDCRTERTKYDILSDATYDLIWGRCHQEIMKGETKHLLVLISLPVAYPRMAWLENMTSKVIDPVRSLSKVGLFGSSENRVGNGAESLDDHWTAKLHKLERKWLIEDLQELAAQKSVRITILGGDANLAAMGQFYADPKLEIPKDMDYRYMPNVVSSPIVNAPVPDIMSDALNRRNKVHHVDTKTMEDMRPIFTHDVDGKPRNNKRLLPRRNWCCIREYAPGSTPAHTPSEPSTPDHPRVGNLARSLSLSRGEGRSFGRSFSISRRFSLRGPPPSKGADQIVSVPQSNTKEAVPRPLEHGDGYFPPQPIRPQSDEAGHEPRPGDFIRRRTDLSVRDVKQALRQGSDMHHFINLEGGLDITLNCEVSSTDPAGITTPYRVLVPALAFDGEFEPSIPLQKKRWWMIGPKRAEAGQQNQDNLSDDEDDDHPAPDADRLYSDSPTQGKQGPSPPPDGVEQGYSGVDAYKPKKRRFGLF